MWKALLGESFRAWASVLLAVPVNFIVMPNFGRPGDPVRLITLSSPGSPLHSRLRT